MVNQSGLQGEDQSWAEADDGAEIVIFHGYSTSNYLSVSAYKHNLKDEDLTDVTTEVKGTCVVVVVLFFAIISHKMAFGAPLN